MDDHIATALEEFEHALPKQHHHGPSRAIMPKCGAKVQHVEEDTSRGPQPHEIKRMQKAVGKFPFPAQAVDDAILHASNDIACDVNKATERTLQAAIHLLNCIACNCEPKIKHHASDTFPHIASDADKVDTKT